MKINRIETGKVKIKENQVKRTNGLGPKMTKVLLGKNWTEWLPIYAWAIEHPEGVIVVDTGETHKTGKKRYLPKWHPYYSLAVDFDVRPEQEIGPQLKRIGIDPKKDVNKVIMTHLHTDHVGGIYHFPNSEIIIEKNEYNAASGLTGILAGYLPHRWPKWLNPTQLTLPDDPFFSFPKSIPVTRDKKVMIVGTPGHVVNHMSVVVEMNGVFYFLAGDTSYNEINLIELDPDGIGTKESLKTLQNIHLFAETNPTIYLPSHDPAVPNRMINNQIVPVYKKTIAS